MKSNQSSDGRFPYGGQSDYRNFLIPKKLVEEFSLLKKHNQQSSDPLIIAKYFNPAWSQTWYMTEYDSETEVFYGFVTWMPFPEWGCISLKDFIELKLPFGLKIERDLHFPFQPHFSDAVPESERLPS